MSRTRNSEDEKKKSTECKEEITRFATAENNTTEDRKTMEQINKTKSWFFEINVIDLFLIRKKY